ncbi:MAG: fibronectin type III domain-containing protein [Kiritimatiellae bacterium]|nr:fibronectin type III domain-containing protein [Kiritimatiellia bacterium]
MCCIGEGLTRRLFALTLALGFTLLAALSIQAAGPLPGINSASRYLQYYGSDFSEASLNAMKSFDVVVLDARVASCSPAVVAELQNGGVAYVLAYISIGEDPGSEPVIIADGSGPIYHDRTNVVFENNGVASFYIDQEWNADLSPTPGWDYYTNYFQDGYADVNGEFGSRFVCPNADWRWVLNEQRIGGVSGYAALENRSVPGLKQLAGARVSDSDTNRTHDFGFDGFFYDTLDTAGPFTGSRSYPWVAQAMSETVQWIHQAYPNHVAFANRGVFYFNPNIVNVTWNVRPYDHAIRPFIHASLFESYTLDSNAGNPGVSPYVDDNKHNWAPKINAEANRPDGFTVFCMDYMMNRGTALYDQALQESIAAQGWVEYLATNGAIDTIGTYVIAHPPAADSAAPAWDSTAATWAYDPPDRVGIQSVTLGANPGEVVVAWDVARDQTGPVKYNIYQSTEPTFANPTIYANVAFAVGDGWEQSTVDACANQFTVCGLSPGTYYFRVRAEDSTASAYEDSNTVTLSIVVGGGDTVSNPVIEDGITLDGNLADWAGLAAFASDADDVSGGENPLDWLSCAMAHGEDTLFIAYQNDGAITLNGACDAFLDTDASRATGFRGGNDNFPVGAEYLLQGNSLYQYTGNGTSWNWSFVTTAASSVSGSAAELSLPLAALGSTTAIDCFFYGDNPAVGGSTVDLYPDSALLAGGGGALFRYRIRDVSNTASPVVNGDLSDWAALTSLGTDPDDVGGANNLLDWLEVSAANDGVSFYLAYRNDGAVTLNGAYNAYLDTDMSRSTGFRGGSDDFPVGADLLVQGAGVYQYTGTGLNWSWSYIGAAASAVSGSDVELSLPRSWMDNATLINVFFYGDNGVTGGDVTDLAPDGALAAGGGAFFTYRARRVSNTAGITVDGDPADWSSLAQFGTDPDDVSGPSNPADWKVCGLAHDGNNVYFALRFYDTITGLNTAFNFLLDTDASRATGYRGGADNFPVGAEYLMQGIYLYQYTGDGTSWSWSYLGSAGYGWSGDFAELFMPRSWIGSPARIDLFYFGDNIAAGGTTQDYYPDDALRTGGGGGHFRYAIQ